MAAGPRGSRGPLITEASCRYRRERSGLAYTATGHRGGDRPWGHRTTRWPGAPSSPTEPRHVLLGPVGEAGERERTPQPLRRVRDGRPYRRFGTAVPRSLRWEMPPTAIGPATRMRCDLPKTPACRHARPRAVRHSAGCPSRRRSLRTPSRRPAGEPFVQLRGARLGVGSVEVAPARAVRVRGLDVPREPDAVVIDDAGLLTATGVGPDVRAVRHPAAVDVLKLQGVPRVTFPDADVDRVGTGPLVADQVVPTSRIVLRVGTEPVRARRRRVADRGAGGPPRPMVAPPARAAVAAVRRGCTRSSRVSAWCASPCTSGALVRGLGCFPLLVRASMCLFSFRRERRVGNAGRGVASCTVKRGFRCRGAQRAGILACPGPSSPTSRPVSWGVPPARRIPCPPGTSRSAPTALTDLALGRIQDGRRTRVHNIAVGALRRSRAPKRPLTGPSGHDQPRQDTHEPPGDPHTKVSKYSRPSNKASLNGECIVYQSLVGPLRPAARGTLSGGPAHPAGSRPRERPEIVTLPIPLLPAAPADAVPVEVRTLRADPVAVPERLLRDPSLRHTRPDADSRACCGTARSGPGSGPPWSPPYPTALPCPRRTSTFR